MNFADARGSFGADPSVLSPELVISTGMGARSRFAWVIHSFEFQLKNENAMTVPNTLMLALSTAQGLAEVPEFGEGNCILRDDWTIAGATSGFTTVTQRQKTKQMLPPVIVASARVSIYFRTDAGCAGWANDDINFRIGYTTVETDSQTWLEIAEAFENA
jgi:hypothetical protein